jgi:hypothetical protein
MNFQDLLTKMKHLDEAPVEPKDECGETKSPSDTLFGEQGVEECGMPGMDNMPHGMMGTPKQSDSVTMNVSMNGSGAGGIRDLMSILKNIEQGAPEHDHDADDVLVGVGEEQGDGNFSKATTTPNPETSTPDDVIRAGDDLNRSKDMYAKSQDGDNAMAVNEGLVSHLANLYEEIKLR